jgi:2-hydroxychromene-2-carboxylate isomerase
MAKTVTFYFDLGSPASYLASTQLPRIAVETGAVLDWRPVLLGGIFKATGNRSPAEIPGKGVYIFRDFQRFAARYGVPFEMNPYFPVNTLVAMRVVTGVGLVRPEALPRLVATLFRTLWVEGKNCADPAVLADAIAAAEVDPGEALERAQHAVVKDRLRQETEEAVARGLFGVPTMFVGEDMFWGQDRLDFVRETLTDSAPGR